MEFKDKYTNSSPPINHHVRLFTFIIIFAGVIAAVFYAYTYICGPSCINSNTNPDSTFPVKTIPVNSNTLTPAEWELKKAQIEESLKASPTPLTDAELKIKQAQLEEARNSKPTPMTEAELKIKQEQLNNI